MSDITFAEDQQEQVDVVVKKRRGGRIVAKPKRVAVDETKLYAFKVMKRMDNGLLHSGSVPLRSKLHKTYQQGHKTSVTKEMFDNGYGICVFPTLEAAQRWNGTNPGTREIWKVEVGEIRQPAEKRLSITVLESYFPASKMSKTSYGRVVRVLLKESYKSSWPAGAMIADYVIPVEKVQ